MVTSKALKVNPLHYQELKSSGIHDDLIRLNFESVNFNAALANLLYAIPDNELRRNDRRLRDYWLKTYKHLEFGCWVVYGNDKNNPNFCQIKTDIFRHDKDNKPVKYETPVRANTGIFRLRVTYRIGLRIAKKQGFKKAYLDRINQTDNDLPLTEKLRLEDTGFWEFIMENTNITLIITEGAKKAASLLSKGYLAIALPGSPNFRDKETQDLKLSIIELVKDRQIYLAFDMDRKIKSIKNVSGSVLAFGRLASRNHNSIVGYLTWDLAYKGCDDLIVNQGVKAFEDSLNNAVDYKEYQVIQDLNIRYLIPSNLEVDQRYLQIDLTKIDNKLVAIKSAKGTGKTELLKAITTYNKLKGIKTLVIGHRVQLARQQAQRLGLISYEDYYNNPNNYENMFGLITTFDSLHKVNLTEFEGCQIIIDEVDQVFSHGLFSNTCILERSPILYKLTELLKNCEQCIIASADIDNNILDSCKQLTDCIDPFIIENKYNPYKGRKCCFYEGNNPSTLLDNLYKQIDNGSTKHIVHVSGQKAKSNYSTKTLERLLRERYPDLYILRIDAETIADPNHAAYRITDNLEILEFVDIVICSPTIETGVSIDIEGHFNAVWCIIYGVQSVNATLQSIERLRDDVPRHVWVSKKGLGSLRKFNGSKKAKYLNYQCNAIFSYLETQFPELFSDLDDSSFNAYQTLYNQLAAEDNKDYNDYRLRTKHSLLRQGYKLFYPDSLDREESQPIIDEIKTIKELNYQDELTAIVESDDLTNSEYSTLETKKEITESERLQVKKHNLKLRYSIDNESLTKELIMLDDDGIYGKLRLHYYMTVGKGFLPDRDKSKISELNNGFKPDVVNVSYSHKIAYINAILEKLPQVNEYSKSNLQSWYDFIMPIRHHIKIVLGITIDTTSAIAALKQILGLTGKSLSRPKKVRLPGNKFERRYQIIDLVVCIDRGLLFENWYSKDQQKYSVDQKCINTMGSCGTKPINNIDTVVCDNTPNQNNHHDLIEDLKVSLMVGKNSVLTWYSSAKKRLGNAFNGFIETLDQATKNAILDLGIAF